MSVLAACVQINPITILVKSCALVIKARQAGTVSKSIQPEEHSLDCWTGNSLALALVGSGPGISAICQICRWAQGHT